MLLLLATVNDLPVAHDNETTVADVGRVQGSVLPVQDEHTGCTAAWRDEIGNEELIIQGRNKELVNSPKIGFFCSSSSQ